LDEKIQAELAGGFTTTPCDTRGNVGRMAIPGDSIFAFAIAKNCVVSHSTFRLVGSSYKEITHSYFSKFFSRFLFHYDQ
jgi:hypothetical protein